MMYMLAIQAIQVRLELQRLLDEQRRADELAKAQQSAVDAMDRENYGRDAIDVEAREVVDVPRLEKS